MIEDNKRLSALLEHQKEDQEKQQELLKRKIDKVEYLHIRLDLIYDRLRTHTFTIEDLHQLFEIQQESEYYDD